MRWNVVIVGAGLAGAATAYHLKRLGVEDVLLLEQAAAPGEHSTGRNASIVRSCVEDPDVQRLADAGADRLGTGDLAPFRRTGGVLVGAGDADVADYFPLATGRGRWFPNDGVTDPAALLHTYLRGQEIRCGCRVERCVATADGVRVITNQGDLAAQRVVNAAGPWAGVVGGLPLVALNRHLMVTPAMAEVSPDWPYVWDVVHGLYFRPEGDGLLLCPCDESARPPGDYRVDHEVNTRLAELLGQHQPRLADVAVRTVWTGQRTFAADRKFVIGFDPRHAWLFHVAGLGGHGVTTSYAVGRLAARMLATGGEESGNPFAPARLLKAAKARDLLPVADR
jgi:glycine/D-amino acid oxidase-like deaminating enzyme